MSKLLLLLPLTATLLLGSLPAAAAGEQAHPRTPGGGWTFEGPLGTFDRHQLQRGYQVYKQVCSACHAMKQISFRNLTAIGFTNEEVKALAAQIMVKDGPNDEGEMFERVGLPSDRLPSPFPNEKAARAANNGAYPLDLSLITKARKDGPNYVYSLLTGYHEPPAEIKAKMMPGMHYNPYMAGGQIAMANPLSEGVVTYADGTQATVDQMAQDVATFLTWTAEPHLEARKQTGVMVILFLLVFAVIMYLAKKEVWRDQH